MEEQSSRTFDNSKVLAISRQHQTPFFLYSVDVIRDRIRTLLASFSGRFEVAVSLKANPNPNLLRRLIMDAQWFDVASLGEFLLATIAGVPPTRIIFIGPGKTTQELEAVIQRSVGLLVAESVEELRHIERISRVLGKCTDVLLRVNPEIRQVSAGMQMGGVPCQFGIPTAELPGAIDLIRVMSHVCFKGIHVYSGSQVLDACTLLKTFEHIIAIARMVQDLHGDAPAVIDFGGGFGVPYFPHEMPLDTKALRSEVSGLLARHGAWLDKHHCRLLIESGRFLFADAGVYVCSVLYKKHSYGTTYVVLDGGSNFHSSLSGLGKIVRANFPMYSISADRSEAADVHDNVQRCNVVGPLCTPKDTLARNVVLENDRPGDLVVFEKAGAYGLTFSQERFLGHTSISEFLCERGQVELIKRRRSLDDLEREYDVGTGVT